ncbi:MAG TPA: hypothetical protein ENK99_08170 [Campylobacterales bacterium]|nr:hypothetical protein [Campylobacterales bacterium]
MNTQDKDNQIIIYNTEDGETKIEVRMKDEVDNISLHLKNIFKEGELKEISTTEESSIVQTEGGRRINRPVTLYNLDAIISVGYRINSLRGTQFRIWATQKLKEYIVKGFVKLNNEEDQPKNMRQYFTIETTNNKDVLVLDEIVALNDLPAQSIGKTKSVKKGVSGDTTTLEDQNGLQLFYNKNSKGVTLDDAKLITSDSDYEDFTRKFLK